MFVVLKIVTLLLAITVCQFQQELRHLGRLGGTIKDVPNLNATADAIRLRQAMRGLGTDENSVVNLMTTRSINDRIRIANAYKQMYGKDLGFKFAWEFSFHAKEVLEDMLVAPIDYDAQILYSSMKGFGTDLDSMTAVLCSKDHNDIEGIKQSYQRRYGKPLEKAIENDVADPLLNLYRLLINAPREQNVNPQLVESDVRDIMGVDLKHLHNDNALFKILAGRSKDHIKQVMDLYQRRTNTPLTSVLGQDLSGPVTAQGKTVRTVKNLIECYVDAPKFYAQQIENYIKGAGTKDKKLFRLLISRSEIDLEDIKNEYQKMFGQNLVNRLERESSGTYGKLIKGLVTGNRALVQEFPQQIRRPSYPSYPPYQQQSGRPSYSQEARPSYAYPQQPSSRPSYSHEERPSYAYPQQQSRPSYPYPNPQPEGPV